MCVRFLTICQFCDSVNKILSLFCVHFIHFVLRAVSKDKKTKRQKYKKTKRQKDKKTKRQKDKKAKRDRKTRYTTRRGDKVRIVQIRIPDHLSFLSLISRSNIRDKYKIDAPVNEEEEESEEEDDDGFSGQKKKEEVEEDPVERNIQKFYQAFVDSCSKP